MKAITRLLVATPLYPPEPGGPATYARLIEREFPLRGVEVDVVKFSDVRHAPKVVRHCAYFFRVLAQGRTVDALYALDPVSVGFPTALAALLLRKPFYVKVVGDYAWEQGRQRFGVTADLDTFVKTTSVPCAVRGLRWVQRFVAHRAKKVVVPSAYLKSIVSTWGVRSDIIEVVFNAVEPHERGVCPEAVAAVEGLIVVYIGRLVPWKHVDQTMDAVHSVQTSGVALSLVVVGTGPLEEELKKKAHDEQLSVLFVGALSPEDTQAVLEKADILVLNSSYEGLSHVLIEGLMHGKAIVATDAGGNGELIEDTKSGLLVPVGDPGALSEAIRAVCIREELRTAIERGAHERSRAFTVASMVSGTLQVLS